MNPPPLPPAGEALPKGDVHLCDNYLHLLTATADLASHQPGPESGRPTLFFITDGLPLDEALRSRLVELTGADIVPVSDTGSVEAYARLPRWVPGQIRRNLSWESARILRPCNWSPEFLAERSFLDGYVYHPGFFLSKVVAGHCDRVIMRDSGYANYVRHRVPLRRMLPRLLAGRNPRHQTWGEEPWVDAIQVVQPDHLPPSARRKATKLTLDELMRRLTPELSRDVALAFWGAEPIQLEGDRTALIASQPIDQLGICSTTQKFELYEAIAARLEAKGYTVAVKPHPRETHPPLPSRLHLQRAFPIEAWTWAGQAPFDVAVSLNSTALSDPDSTLARSHLQLVAPECFYTRFWGDWPLMIDRAFDRWAEEATEERRS